MARKMLAEPIMQLHKQSMAKRSTGKGAEALQEGRRRAAGHRMRPRAAQAHLAPVSTHQGDSRLQPGDAAVDLQEAGTPA